MSTEKRTTTKTNAQWLEEATKTGDHKNESKNGSLYECRNQKGRKKMIENDTWYRCNICGREGRVGRCCSDEDRTPLNALAKAEQERIKYVGLIDCPQCGKQFDQTVCSCGYEHSCGGPSEACCIPGCSECGTPTLAEGRALEHEPEKRTACRDCGLPGPFRGGLCAGCADARDAEEPNT